MNPNIIAMLFVLLLFLFGSIVYLILTLRRPSRDQGSLQLLQQQLLELQRGIDARLSDSNRLLQEQFKTSNETFVKNQGTMFGVAKDSMKKIEEVTEKLVRLEQTNKQIMGIGDQLKGLENILKNPKQRGILGEYFLETLLKNIFQPNQYQMQYTFSNGDIVDAVIFVRDKIIPIDSKFSLENYNRIVEESDEAKRDELSKAFKADLKKRIDETSKYILPSEGTMEFVFMFIPSEGIYYDLLINQVGTIKINTHDLIEYAFRKNVIIVSPTSFYAYLQTVLQGLNALKIEEKAKEIRKQVEGLGKHLHAYEDYLSRLGNTLGTTVNHYNNATKEWGKIDKDVVKITEGTVGGEARLGLLEKPEENHG